MDQALVSGLASFAHFSIWGDIFKKQSVFLPLYI